MILAFVGSAAIPTTRPLTKPLVDPLVREAGPMAVQLDVLSERPAPNGACVGAVVPPVLGVHGVATLRWCCCGFACPNTAGATVDKTIMAARKSDTVERFIRTSFTQF